MPSCSLRTEGAATRPVTWFWPRALEWARRLGASPPMRMTASWLRSSRIDRIQVCGAMLAPDGELPLGIFVIGNIKSREETRSKRHFYWNRPPQSNKSAAVLAAIKGKSFRDGIRPTLTAAARQRPRKIRSGRGDGRRQIEQGDGIDSSLDINRPIQVTDRAIEAWYYPSIA